MKKSILFTTSISIISLAICLAGLKTFQVSAEGGQSLEIMPPLITMSANPGETKNATINIRNISGGDVVVSNQINDFKSNDKDGTPVLILDSKETTPFSIKSWITPISEMTLKPKQIKNLSVAIKIPSNTAPGSYFGAVRFTGTAPELKGTGVSLAASIGTLIIIKVKGDATEGMSIKNFEASADKKTGWLFESAPITLSATLSNSGNVHEQPAAQTTITDMFGKKIAVVNLNMPVRTILPKSTRIFSNDLGKSVIGNKMLFGRYTASLKVLYGTKGQSLTTSMVFWVIPYKLIALVTGLIIFGFFVLRTSVRKYNRHVIKKYQKRR